MDRHKFPYGPILELETMQQNEKETEKNAMKTQRAFRSRIRLVNRLEYMAKEQKGIIQIWHTHIAELWLCE